MVIRVCFKHRVQYDDGEECPSCKLDREIEECLAVPVRKPRTMDNLRIFPKPARQKKK